MSKLLWSLLLMACLFGIGTGMEVKAVIAFGCTEDCDFNNSLERETFTPAPDNMVWAATQNASTGAIENCWCEPDSVKVKVEDLSEYLDYRLGATYISILPGNDSMVEIASHGEAFTFRKEELSDGSDKALMIASDFDGIPGKAVGYIMEGEKRHDFTLWYRVLGPETIDIDILDLNGREQFNATETVVVYEA